jgi:hypothetical protein
MPETLITAHQLGGYVELSQQMVGLDAVAQ